MGINLGFTPQEINYAKTIYQVAGMWVPKVSQQVMGNDYYQFSDSVKYLVGLMQNDNFIDAVNTFKTTKSFYEIPTDEINIMQQHFKKMCNKYYRQSPFYNNDYFASMAIKEVHSYVKFRNLEEPFDIYNDGRYVQEIENRYQLVKKGSKKTKVITSRCPYAESEEDLKGNSDVKITKDDYEPDKYIVEVENSHVGILNRFGIIISTKPPQFHSGCFIHLTGAGNTIYVFAIELSKDYNIDKRIATKQGVMSNFLVVTGYGFTKKELEGYIDPVTKRRVEGLLEKTSNYIKTNCDIRISALVLPEHEFEEKINWLVDLPEDTTFGEGGDIFDNADSMFSDSDTGNDDIFETDDFNFGD